MSAARNKKKPNRSSIKTSAALPLFIIVLLVGLSPGCSSAPRLTQEDFLPAQPLDALGVVTVSVGIGKLDPVMPVGTQVGNIYSNFGKAKTALRSGHETSGAYRKYFYQELRKAGYQTAGNETIFEARDLAKAQVIIGGDITAAKVNVFQSMKAETVEYDIKILWRVFDRKTEREIFEAETRGSARAESFTQAEAGAFQASFLKLLAQSDFIDALKR